MLDPDEVADYEAWKARRLESSIDLSPHAYNTEMEANAISWEEGVRAAFAGMIARHDQEDVFASNPFRAKGMRGYRSEPDAGVPANRARAGTRAESSADQSRDDFES